MSGVLPSNLSFFFQRMEGVSSSHFKVFPQSSDNATSGKIIRFELPSNSLLNLRNCRLMMNVATSGGGVSIPNDVSSLIERCAVYMGGVLVQNNFSGYNVLRHAKASLQGSKADLALNHKEIVRQISYHDGTTLGNTDNEAYTSLDDQMAITDWEGLLGSIEPSIIDAGLFPQITLELTMADSTVCPISEGRVLPTGAGSATDNFDKTGAGNPTYSLTNLSLQIEVLGLATSVLDQIVEQRISSVGYLSLPFTNYYSFSSTHNSTTRFNVNSASWDKLWICYRDTAYSAKSAPRIVSGYKKAGAFVDATTGGTSANIDLGKPSYDAGGSSTLNNNCEKYISNYFRFQQVKADAGVDSYFQLQVNSASVPAYRLTVPEMYALSMNSVDHKEPTHNITLDQYKNDYFVQCYRFCLPDSAKNRMASGLNTRSVSAMASLETTNIASCNLMLFAQTTCELRCGAGRAIEVIN